jgi:hypothetical protein
VKIEKRIKYSKRKELSRHFVEGTPALIKRMENRGDMQHRLEMKKKKKNEKRKKKRKVSSWQIRRISAATLQPFSTENFPCS